MSTSIKIDISFSEKADNQDSDARIKTDIFSLDSFTASWKFLLETLMEELEQVKMEN